MNTKAAIMGSFLGACAIITYRDIKNPDATWPLPAPPPYRYVGAGVAFGLLALVGNFLNEKLAATLAVGLLVGLGFQTAQSGFPGDFGAGQNRGSGSGSGDTGSGGFYGGQVPPTAGEGIRPL